jgi:hypothetical protein
MLVSCFDASGKTPSLQPLRNPRKKRLKIALDLPVMAVAGFASQAGMWVEFDALWSEVLKRYHVPLFHAGDFAHSKPPFDQGWKGEESKRRDFQTELMGVIQTCGLRKFGSILSVADKHKARAVMNLETDSTATPYVMCSRAVVEDFMAHAIGQGQIFNVQYIFEKGDEEDTLRQHFRKHSFHEPSFAWSKEVEKKGIIAKPFIGLQAAGWIVWEYYMSFSRSFGEFFKHDIKGRWALQTFDDHRQVPGEVKILFKSNPMVDFMRQFEANFIDLKANVAEATKRIEAAKREGTK